jgi:hypothetical protein
MVIGSGRYPHLSRLMIEAETPHADDRFERAFHRGLDHILAGLEDSRPVTRVGAVGRIRKTAPTRR